MLVLQEQGCCLHVVLFRGDVERWKMDFSTRVIFQENGNHFVMALLKGDRKWSEAVLQYSEYSRQHLRRNLSDVVMTL